MDLIEIEHSTSNESLNNNATINVTTITATSIGCDYQNISRDLIDWLDTANDMASFVIMSLASIVMVVFIFRSRRRLKSLPNNKARKSQIRDVKFAVTSISLNLFFFLTNAPFSVYNLVSIHLFPNIDYNL